MSRFSQIAAGTRARKTVMLEIADEPRKIDLRVLGPFEWSEVLTAARAFAVSKGVVDPDEGDPLYELGLHVHTLLLACIDSDSPTDAPAPFFDSAEQMLNSSIIGRDHLAMLFAHHEVWEWECSPRAKELDKAEFARIIAAAGQGDVGPFCRLRPGMQLVCMRSLAELYWSSQSASSPSTIVS